MTDPLLAATGLHKRFGSVVANAGIDFELRPREVHAVIGPNGGGKTTLLGLLTGELRPESGTVRICGQDCTYLSVAKRARLGLAKSYQISSVFPGFTVLENLAFGLRARNGTSSRFWRPAGLDGDAGDAAAAILRRVGLAGRSSIDAADLSHGEHRQLEIAIALSTGPKVLLLDEPLAGLGPDESRRMIELIAGLAGPPAPIAIVLVEHDMDAVFALSDRVTVLAEGAVVARGTPREIRDDAKVRESYLGADGLGAKASRLHSRP